MAEKTHDGDDTFEVHDDIENGKPSDSHVENIRQSQPHFDIDPVLSKKLDRKVDYHIIPWLFGIWLFAFIDRSNIGNAKIDGLTEDLNISTGTKFNIALLVFYIPYILVDVPSNWIVKKVRAADARFLTPEERKQAMKRLREDSHGATNVEDVNDEHFSWHWARMAMLAPQTYFCALAWIFLLIPLYSFSLFLPSIIQGLGYRNTTQAQLLTVPPNMAAFFVVLLTASLSDRIKARGPIMAVGTLVALCGYIMILASKSNGVRYGGTFLIATGVYPGSAMIMGWLSNNLAPHYVRATGVGLLIGLANMAAFPATFIYLQKNA
ncbi:hypothetical protein COL922a_009272 [Colletotrichum nupharicola]|nr:hypothetical protein COL922a_009272 [Colletotrichum nupharicola]